MISAGGAIIARHPVWTGLVGLLVTALVLLMLDGSPGDPAAAGRAGNEPAIVEGFARTPLPRPTKPEPEPRPAPRRAPHFRIATVAPGASVALRSSPGGPVVAVAGPGTEWGSQRNFWVERHRGDWLGAPAPELPNGRLAWIKRTSALRISSTPYSITADLSRRRVSLRRGRRVVHSFPVAVGAPGSPTPPGRYSVTDGLVTRGLERYYGCCVLALSGHQENLPAYWIGGDRIAIHGTGSDGTTAGCLRASDADLVALFRVVPLGTPVIIRA